MAKNSGNYIPDQGDIVWLDFDPVKGHEQAGRRPALVLSPNNYNGKIHLCLVCPITTKEKGFEFEVPVSGKIKGVVLADQVRSMSWTERNCSFVCRVDTKTLASVTSIVNLLLPDIF